MCRAMSTLGFDRYVDPLKIYLGKYRDSVRGDRPEKKVSSSSQPSVAVSGSGAIAPPKMGIAMSSDGPMYAYETTSGIVTMLQGDFNVPSTAPGKNEVIPSIFFP
jgi:hypothetical protein